MRTCQLLVVIDDQRLGAEHLVRDELLLGGRHHVEQADRLVAERTQPP